MLKLFILLTLTTVTFLQTIPAYCGVTRTGSFQISVIIPEHVMSYSGLATAPFSNNINQLIQTETVVRNNKSITLTSIVVP
jgi:hypothetical protein